MVPAVTVSRVTNTSRYLAGLCVTALGLCAGGWLILTPYAFGYPGHGRAAVTALATGGGLAVLCTGALVCWAILWRRKLRADGVLPARPTRRSQRSARRRERAERLVAAARQRQLEVAPDPAQVLTDLRALLTPLLADSGVRLVPAPRNSAEPPAAEMPVAESAVAETPDEGLSPAVVEEEAADEPVEVPGHLRGTRSAAFLATRRPAAPAVVTLPEDLGRPADSLLRGAELLMVGTGEEEAW